MIYKINKLKPKMINNIKYMISKKDSFFNKSQT
jgi:hypothetical protein